MATVEEKLAELERLTSKGVVDGLLDAAIVRMKAANDAGETWKEVTAEVTAEDSDESSDYIAENGGAEAVKGVDVAEQLATTVFGTAVAQEAIAAAIEAAVEGVVAKSASDVTELREEVDGLSRTLGVLVGEQPRGEALLVRSVTSKDAELSDQPDNAPAAKDGPLGIEGLLGEVMGRFGADGGGSVTIAPPAA